MDGNGFSTQGAPVRRSVAGFLVGNVAVINTRRRANSGRAGDPGIDLGAIDAAGVRMSETSHESCQPRAGAGLRRRIRRQRRHIRGLENARTKARTLARLQSEARTHKRVWFQFGVILDVLLQRHRRMPFAGYREADNKGRTFRVQIVVAQNFAAMFADDAINRYSGPSPSPGHVFGRNERSKMCSDRQCGAVVAE